MLKKFGSFSLIFGILSGIACQGVNGASNIFVSESDYAYFEKDKQDNKEYTEKSEAEVRKIKSKLDKVTENSKGVLDRFLPADGETKIKVLDNSSSNACSLYTRKTIKGSKIRENKRRLRRFPLIINPILNLAWLVPFLRNWGPLKRYYNFWHYKGNDFPEVLKRMLEIIFLVDLFFIVWFISSLISHHRIESNSDRSLLSISGVCAISPLISRVCGMFLAETWNECALTFVFGVGTTQFLTSTVDVISRRIEERRRIEIILAGIRMQANE